MSGENGEPRSGLGWFFKGAASAPPGPEPAGTLAADPPESPVPAAPSPVKPDGWLSRLKAGMTKTSSRLGGGIASIFTKRKLDSATLEELEDLLVEADLGVETAARVTGALRKNRYEKDVSAEDVRGVLSAEIARTLEPLARPLTASGGSRPHVVLFVGVNGTGKTTTIGKLAARLANEGRKVLVVAGDTFRAAAIEQLRVWGERSGAEVVHGEPGADAAGLAFDALARASAGGHDAVLIDTAGRLQNKAALMGELEKIVRVLRKKDPEAPHDVVLVVDATTGQNALAQVDAFREKAGVTGLIMTKLDGTAKGGILVAIAARHKLPIHAVGVGEGIDDLQPFDARAFAQALVAP